MDSLKKYVTFITDHLRQSAALLKYVLYLRLMESKRKFM